MTNLATSYKPASSVSNPFDVGNYTLTISSDTSNYNVYDEFVSKYGTPPASPTLIVTVATNVIVDSANDQPAMRWGLFWTGTPVFSLINNGYIIGHGGPGGSAGFAPTACNGETGFVALSLDIQTVSITNGSGFIWGGGGGGGAGGTSTGPAAGGGGGGGGAGNGGGGPGGASPAEEGQDAADTGALPIQTGGAGGASNGDGGDGGAGGAYGQDGSPGSVAANPDPPLLPGTGGAAGKAIDLLFGTANFVSGNSAPHVLGAVS